MTISPKKIKEGFIGQRMIVLPPNIKKEVVKNELIKRFYLTAIGYYPRANYHDRTRKSGANEYILLYCVEGKGRVACQEKNVELTANTYIILPQNKPHHYQSSQDDPWSIYWVHFTGDNADVMYDRYLANKNDWYEIAYSEQRINTFDEMFDELADSFDIRELELINIKLQQYIASFVYIKERNVSGQTSDIVSDSINFMKANLPGHYSLQQLADQHCISITHYSRLFRQRTGSSPIQYFNQLKVQKACQYLYFTDHSIKEICMKIGLEDPYYFSRLFKKLMGISPAGYKNKHKRHQ